MGTKRLSLRQQRRTEEHLVATRIAAGAAEFTSLSVKAPISDSGTFIVRDDRYPNKIFAVTIKRGGKQ